MSSSGTGDGGGGGSGNAPHRGSRRFRAAAEGDNSTAGGESPRWASRKSVYSTLGEGGSGDGATRSSSRRSLLHSSADAGSSASSSTPRRQTSTSSLSHEDEIERIREMRARRLRNERLERGEDDPGSSATITSRTSSDRRLSSSRPSSSRSISREGVGVSSGGPSRFRSNPSISRRELEEAGLVRSSTARASASTNSDGDDDIVNVSSYSKARRERLAAASAAAGSGGGNSSTASSSSSLDTNEESDIGRGREIRHRSDIEARLAARRMSRERMEAGSASIITSGKLGGSNDPRVRRRDADDSRPPRRSSISEVSQHSTSSRNTTDTSDHGTGTTYRDRRQRPNRSSTGDELQYSARERLRERAKRSTPQRARSADAELIPMDISEGGGENDFIDSLDARENRKKAQEPMPARAKSVSDVGTMDDNPESEDRKRSSTSDLTTRLRERREARAAEREAREKGRKEMNDLNAYRRRPAPSKATGSSADISRDLSPTSHSSSTRSKPPARLQDLELDNDDDENGGTAGWSLRLCVISAVDLPFNVLPNTPLCPVLKFGLVKIPKEGASESTQSVTSVVLDKLGTKSVEDVESARVRTTTSKILSKRDNGNVDFHQEYRWDSVQHPMNVGLCIELCATAVRTPTNFRESPPSAPPGDKTGLGLDSIHQSSRHNDQKRDVTRSLSRSSSGSAPAGSTTPTGTGTPSGSRSFWGRNNRKQAELEAAEAAAAVARMLVEQDGKADGDLDPPSSKTDDTILDTQTATKHSRKKVPGLDVALNSVDVEGKRSAERTEDVRLGSLVIPLTNLPLDTAMKGNEAARLEQWYELETPEELTSTTIRRKKPSILVEISFSSRDAVDDSEDEFEDDDDDEVSMDALHTSVGSALQNRVSFMRRAMLEARGRLKEEKKPQDEVKMEDPVLEPGVIDFVAIVGCGNIGNQKKDGGMKGWVDTTPDCRILEQFPPTADYHAQRGRMALLPEMVQWFCFPEGAKLWRGTGPPSHLDLNLKRFSASSPPTVPSSIAAFDACLDCTTSFSWFVIASNSDEYGSSLVKTYGAVIRFYVPAPTGIDPTQDDFAQAVMGKPVASGSSQNIKRLWVPIGICLTSSLPIIGVMEALLLQLCEELSTLSSVVDKCTLEHVNKSLASLIFNFQKPIAGAVNCAVPFLSNSRRFLLSLPPKTGLPPLPHGRAVISVCRLLGAEGLNFLIAAILTECKILIHSKDIADITMVAEVVTALVYPFVWSLPYIPVLPIGMLEFVEAPLSYILGIPTSCLPLVDPTALDDVVVLDLDNGYSPPEYLPGRRQPKSSLSKQPNPLPASVATNISRAMLKLLRAESEIEREFGGLDFDGHGVPRMDVESLAEREFRVSVAIEICGLLRGYRQCVGHVFNRDKFLKISPAIYEEKREARLIGAGIAPKTSQMAQGQKVVSARSKRFLSNLVNGQNLQQLLESLESDEASFFHEVMELIDESSSDNKGPLLSSPNESGSSKKERIVSQLMKSLQQAEDKVPTYRVDKGKDFEDDDDGDDFGFDDGDFNDFFESFREIDIHPPEDGNFSSFTSTVLSSVKVNSSLESDSDMQAVSMEYLTRLETTPWEYNSVLHVRTDETVTGDGAFVPIQEKVKLRDAIGDRRFRSWKLSQEKKGGSNADLSFLGDTASNHKQGTALDLTSLVSSARSDTTDMSSLSSGTSNLRSSSLSPEQQRVADAKSRDIIRRCLDKAQGGNSHNESDDPFIENGRDLMAEAENALRNPSAQRFLLSILAQRSRLENQKSRSMRRQAAQGNSTSRLDPLAFTCMIRLSCAMLDSCMEYKEYEIAYRLLTLTAGFVTMIEADHELDEEDPSKLIISMTSRIGLHPIFADIGVWKAVMGIHLQERKSAKLSDTRSDEGSGDEDDDDEMDYEAAVATLYEMVGYGIPGEELSRFATRASEENGWFCDDRGRQLVLLARRISIRRDQADAGAAGETGDIDMARKVPDVNDGPESYFGGTETNKDDHAWKSIEWCHPAAPPSRSSSKNKDPKSPLSSPSLSLDQYMKRSAVTALASFGSSVVVSGGLDGGVFLAHSIYDNTDSLDSAATVRGIHLDWGSASRAGAGSSSDGEYGVGAVSCLAAVNGSGQQIHSSGDTDRFNFAEEFELMDHADLMEGSRVVAGTTAGDLRVWSVKEIYTSILTTSSEGGSSAASRLKFSLRGRALSGHRGGVTCIDIPSQVYRPDSLVTGGADGLIKLWSLRAPTGVRRQTDDSEGGTGPQRGRGGDALNTLEGHNGRILCIQTAWHGDHLLSGSSDRTVCVWDLASGGGGKCIHKLYGHLGWVTHTQYWGPNTIVTASTDRSVALWDSRVGNTPLFVLRHHSAPISDLLVGSRTDPYMVTAAAGGIASWDFRALTDSKGGTPLARKQSTGTTGGKLSASCTIVRDPSTAVRPDGLNDLARQKLASGPVLLARGVKDPLNSFMSVGSDGILRTWETSTGASLENFPTGHCDAISGFSSFSYRPVNGMSPSVSDADGSSGNKIEIRGTITSSMDGTIRMRKLIG